MTDNRAIKDRRRAGRPPAGAREGEKVKDYPQLSIRVPAEIKAKLQALSLVSAQPQWRVADTLIGSMQAKAVVGFLVLLTSAVAAWAGSCEWKAPPTAVNRPNPVPSNANAIALGQKLYTANCFTCHGENGKGDGPGAAALEKKPADLGACIKQNNESDGSLFWKISEGRSPMVSWKGALSETQRWELVNYIKTLAGK